MWDVRTASYASKHASHSLFDKTFVTVQLYVLRHINWKLQVICGRSACWTTAILSETLFVSFRVAWEIRLESCSPRHASVVLWYNITRISCSLIQHCVYCNPLRTSLFATQLRLTTKLTYLMTAYYTPNDGFTAKDASFYKNKVG